jgi:hypothetical protein
MKIDSRLVWNSILSVGGVAWIAAVVACGQNASLVDEQAILKHEAAQSSPVVSHPSNPTDDGTTPADPNPGTTAPVTPVTPDPTPGPTSTTTVIYRSGPYQRLFKAVPLDDDDMHHLDLMKLPYIPTLKVPGDDRFKNHPKGTYYRHRVPVLNLGEVHHSGSMAQYTPVHGGIPTVQDAQVVFKIQLRNLPPRNALVDWREPLDDAHLELLLSKASNDGFVKTEMFCSLDAQRCSGSEYTAGNWLDNINDEGFFHGTRPSQYNDALEHLFLAHNAMSGGYKVWWGGVEFPLSTLLATDETLLAHSPGAKVPPAVSVLDLIYGDVSPDAPLVSRDLLFAMVDDTYVSAEVAKLSMTFRVKDGVEIHFEGAADGSVQTSVVHP